MNQKQMIENLKELSAALWHGEDDTVTTLTMWADSLDKAIETLERTRWRKVPDEMPEPNKAVLLLVEGNPLVGCLNRDTNKGYDEDEDEYDDYWATYVREFYKKKVTHWAYLPEEEEDNGETIH